MRLIRSIMLLLAAVCLIAGGFFMVDTHGGKAERYIAEEVDVTSSLTGRVYALEWMLPDESKMLLGDYEKDLDKEIASYLRAHGGGRYTTAEGETAYVASSSSGGGYYSDGGGYYYDDDDYNEWSGGGGDSSGGVYYDDGPGYLVDLDFDDTVYNYCQNCGTHYTGLGGCPNPDCDAYNP